MQVYFQFYFMWVIGSGQLKVDHVEVLELKLMKLYIC